MKHRDRPVPRINPSGKKVWRARPRDAQGERHELGTFKRQGPCRTQGSADCCAQHAIDAFYEKTDGGYLRLGTVGEYAQTWTSRYPRSERTNKTNDSRIGVALKVPIEGKPLAEWEWTSIKRRHVNELIGHLLRQGRATGGVLGIVRALSAMGEDAVGEDEVVNANPFKGVRVKASDPRATKAKREHVILDFAEMHAFAAAAAAVVTPARKETPMSMNTWRSIYAEPMIRMLSDCGLRIGECLALRRELQDLKAGVFVVKGTAYKTTVVESSREKNHDRSGPIPPGCLELLQGMPPRIDSPWLFPTPTGKLWSVRNWYRDVWEPTRAATGVTATPHDLRHSWVSQLTAAGIDSADLAHVAGHGVGVQQEIYRHPLRRSDDAIRSVIG